MMKIFMSLLVALSVFGCSKKNDNGQSLERGMDQIHENNNSHDATK
jgi:hypothetical protein